jgi:hypothetical protein
MGTPLTKQWNPNYGYCESKLRSCSLRRFNLARQDLQNTFATTSAQSGREKEVRVNIDEDEGQQGGVA